MLVKAIVIFCPVAFEEVIVNAETSLAAVHKLQLLIYAGAYAQGVGESQALPGRVAYIQFYLVIPDPIAVLTLETDFKGPAPVESEFSFGHAFPIRTYPVAGAAALETVAAVALKFTAEPEPVALQQRTGLGIPAHAEAREGKLVNAYIFGSERSAPALDAQCIEPALGAQLLFEQELAGRRPELSRCERAAHQRLALRVNKLHNELAPLREKGSLLLPVGNQLELQPFARVESRTVANQHHRLLFLNTIVFVVIFRVKDVFWGKQTFTPGADGPGLDAVSPFPGGKFLAELFRYLGESVDFQFCACNLPVPVVE